MSKDLVDTGQIPRERAINSDEKKTMKGRDACRSDEKGRIEVVGFDFSDRREEREAVGDARATQRAGAPDD
jgi:hypothetical protein